MSTLIPPRPLITYDEGNLVSRGELDGLVGDVGDATLTQELEDVNLLGGDRQVLQDDLVLKGSGS